MARSLDFTDVLAALEKASAFELYRLQRAIDLALEDPARIVPVKAALRPGMTTTWFDRKANDEKPCTVVRVNRKTVTIRQHDDGRLYDVSYCMLNVDGADTRIRQQPTRGISRQELSVGAEVGFVDTRNGRQITGRVERLNPKTVTIRTADGRWRVAYALLFPVIDGVVESSGGGRVIDLLPEPPDEREDGTDRSDPG